MQCALSCWRTYSQMQMVLVMWHLHKSVSSVSQQRCTVASYSMLDYQCSVNVMASYWCVYMHTINQYLSKHILDKLYSG